MKRKRVSPAVSYDEGLLQDLKDPEFAVTYLNAILKDTDKGVKERFLHGLGLVAKAHGVTKIALQTKLQRESLRKALSEKGNPTISTLFSLLHAFGLRLRLDASEGQRKHSISKSESNEPTLGNLQKQIIDLQKTVEAIAMAVADHTVAVATSRSSASQKIKTF